MQEKICPLLTRSADKPFCCLGEKLCLVAHPVLAGTRQDRSLRTAGYCPQH